MRSIRITQTWQLSLIHISIGLFNTVVNLVLLIIVNKASDKMSGNSLW